MKQNFYFQHRIRSKSIPIHWELNSISHNKAIIKNAGETRRDEKLVFIIPIFGFAS